jgi:hypothetical protein
VNCEEFRSNVLRGDENDSTASHEAGCGSCRALAPDLRAASAALSSVAVWEEPSLELGGQVEALIGAAAGTRRDNTTSSSRSDRRWLAPFAVAASIVALLAVFAFNRAPSPDWEVALPATELAPGASGSVQGWNEPSGTRMLVAIDGLAPAPEGFMYEFWLSKGPVHVSAGTFRTGGEIELWSGVTRADYPRLWITLEAIDDDESPSPDTVLDTAGSA